MQNRLELLLRQQLRLSRLLGNNIPTNTNTQVEATNRISLVGTQLTDISTLLSQKHPHQISTIQVNQEWSTGTRTQLANSHLIILHYPTPNHHRPEDHHALALLHQPTLVVIDTGDIPKKYIKLTTPPSSASNHQETVCINLSAALRATQKELGDDHCHLIDQIRHSGLLELNQAISRALNRPSEEIHTRILFSQSELALHLHSERLLRLSHHIHSAQQRLYTYQIRLNKLKKQLHHSQQLLLAEKISLDVSPVLTRLGFFSLPFRAHSVGHYVLQHLQETGLDEMEKRLIFHAGQVKLMHENVEEVVQELAADGELKEYRRETEMNGVMQGRRYGELWGAEAMGSVGILAARKRQLVGQGGPLHVLQTRAHALLRNNVAAGAGLSVFSLASYWNSYQLLLTPALQGDSLTAHNYHNHPAITSLFLLVSLIYLSQSSWSKSLNAFRNDFARWNEALKNDLLTQQQKTAAQMFRLSVPLHATDDASAAGGGERGDDETRSQDKGGEVDLLDSMRDRMEARMRVPDEDRRRIAADPLVAEMARSSQLAPPETLGQWIQLTQSLLGKLKIQYFHHHLHQQQQQQHSHPSVPPPSS
ncbi:hypothetical protein PCANC_14182 [Puccinia coronata f. sp. avenae]|uniref:Uncharacterized protein n=1 Tax=Puccinia coronata f. sp. avenae TaxID=200324 RepID=A0A2N5UK40_9BASI|nr:hypothetical protein PCASD_19293 [Puccinia coronata f. sp. avenae]PLW38131.1 hypothetical protein PCANC_14182 [Puccinia coronata f. sp. avenae]PLW46610.1 hypothetical protein PCASD_07392 [Puccinia coronata f. sp. avenae]